MEDVLDVYQRPYHPRRPVVGLDEKSKELHGTPRGGLPPEPGQAARQDYEYERHGVCNLFLAFEAWRGWRKVRVTDHRTKQDFAEQLRLLADEDYSRRRSDCAGGGQLEHPRPGLPVRALCP